MLTPEQIVIFSKGILVLTVVYCLYGFIQILKGDGDEHRR